MTLAMDSWSEVEDLAKIPWRAKSRANDIHGKPFAFDKKGLGRQRRAGLDFFDIW
jgi:hypothetical protein